MVRTTIYIPDDIHRDLKVFAAKSGLSVTETILEALKLTAFAGTINAKPLTPNKEKVADKLSAEIENRYNMCKHGSAVGLCKFGCKKGGK